MALKAILTAAEHEALDEGVSALYIDMEGREGHFVLDVSPVDGHALENVKGLKSSLQKERTNVKDAAKKLAEFGELSPADAAAAVTKVAEMANWKPDEKIEEQMKAREDKIALKHANEAKASADTIAKLQDNLRVEVIDNQAKSAIAAAKGDIDLVLPHLRSQLRVVEEDGRMHARVYDADGTERITTKSGSMAPMSIEELVAEMREKHPTVFEGTKARGSGSTGSEGGSSGGGFNISAEDAQDSTKYQAMKAKASAAGASLTIVE